MAGNLITVRGFSAMGCLATLLLSAVVSTRASAALPPELRIPETTRILRLESHQTCPGCPAWYYELYADGSWSYEGIDSVFMLGEAGSKRWWDGFRNSPAYSDPRAGKTEASRDGFRRTLYEYRANVASSARPDSINARLLRAIRGSGFASWDSEYPAGLGNGAGRAEPVLSIRIDLDGQSKSVRFLADSGPPGLAGLVERILTIGEPFFVGPRYWIQRTPTFRGDPDAELWFARVPNVWKTYGVMLNRSGKVTIVGWNHVGLNDRGFQTHTVQLDAAQVGRLLDELGNAERRPLGNHVYHNPDLQLIVNSVFGTQGDRTRLIQKGRSGALQGSARRTLEDLNRIVDSLVPLLGPNHPAGRNPALPPLPASSPVLK